MNRHRAIVAAARFLHILLLVLCSASLLPKRVWLLQKKITALFTAR